MKQLSVLSRVTMLILSFGAMGFMLFLGNARERHGYTRDPVIHIFKFSHCISLTHCANRPPCLQSVEQCDQGK